MNGRWLAVACAGILLLSASVPASAKPRHKVRPHCVDGPAQFAFWGILTNPAPQPNGCAPPVYAYVRYVGQDPDPYIRLQLKRDPATGYATEFAR